MTAIVKSDHKPQQSAQPVREAETVFVIFENRQDVEPFQEALCRRFPRFGIQEDALAWQQSFYRFQSPAGSTEAESATAGTVSLRDVTELERAVIEQLTAGKAEIKSASEVFDAARRQSQDAE